tara:strand:+ start:78 stop:512 length:435 start_codon:yes stop_codon:yes gene_type:complete
MAYRSKKSQRVATKLAGEKRDIVADKLSGAFSALRDFEVTQRNIQKTDKLMKELSSAGTAIKYISQQNKEKEADYLTAKTTFDNILTKKRKSNPDIVSNFPSFEDYKSGNFKPSIGDQYYNKTTLGYIKAGVSEDIMEAIKGVK